MSPTLRENVMRVRQNHSNLGNPWQWPMSGSGKMKRNRRFRSETPLLTFPCVVVLYTGFLLCSLPNKPCNGAVLLGEHVTQESRRCVYLLNNVCASSHHLLSVTSVCRRRSSCVHGASTSVAKTNAHAALLTYLAALTMLLGKQVKTAAAIHLYLIQNVGH